MSFLESIDAGVPLSALELGDAGMSQSPAQAASAASILSPRFVSTHPLLVRPLAFMLDAALTSAVEACLKIDADAPPSLQGAWQDAIDPIWRFLVAFPLENPASLLTELWGLLDRASQVRTAHCVCGSGMFALPHPNTSQCRRLTPYPLPIHVCCRRFVSGTCTRRCSCDCTRPRCPRMTRQRSCGSFTLSSTRRQRTRTYSWSASCSRLLLHSISLRTGMARRIDRLLAGATRRGGGACGPALRCVRVRGTGAAVRVRVSATLPLAARVM